MNKHFKLLVLFIISFVSIYFAFSGASTFKILEKLNSVDLFRIMIAVLLLILSCVVRAYRWQILLLPFCQIPFHRVFSSTMIGYFGNGVLAFRLGELLKANAVVKGSPVKTSQAFGTVILERILDLIAVLIIFIITIPWFPFNDNDYSTLAYTFSFSLILIIIAIIMLLRYNLLMKIKHLRIFCSGFGKKIFSEMTKVFEGVTIISQIKNIKAVITLSIFLWCLYLVISIFVLNACSIKIGFIELAVLFVIGSIAIGLPALPGSIGTYDLIVTKALENLFNINHMDALNYALVSHAVSYFPFLLIGFVYFLLSNISLGEIKKDREISI